MPAIQPYLVLAALGAVVATAMLGSESEPPMRPAPVRPQVGVAVPSESIHLIERPGLYGVSDPAPGMRYAVVGSSLVRGEAAANRGISDLRGSVRPPA